MSDNRWDSLDALSQADLPPMPQAVALTLRDWCFQEHGLVYGRHYVGHFLDMLAEHGYTVERSVVAGARSYTTLETAQFDHQPVTPPEVNRAVLEPLDVTPGSIPGEEPPARSLG